MMNRLIIFLFLGLNDLIVLCVSIPMTLSAALLQNWVFGAFLCKFLHFAPTLTALVSTFTVAVIAVERWFFIVNKQKFDRRCTILILILLWLVSILIALPDFFSRQIQEWDPQTMLPDMMKNQLLLRGKLPNETYLTENYQKMQPPLKMKRIVFCVLKPDLRMRIFSYIVITVQYLVPFLFVSVSCYSISRFLKRRMKRMRAYQIHHRPIKPIPKLTRKKCSNTTDESTEHELTSYDEFSLNPISNDTKTNYFFSRFRQTFQNPESLNYQHSIQFSDQQHYLKTQSHTTRRFHRSRKLLICVAALFTISWLPLTITQIYLEHNEDLYTGDQANFVYGYLLIPCYLISSLSAWINPVIYNYINRSFRREFYALYACCFKRPSSSMNNRKEITTIGPKRHRRETTHCTELNTCIPQPPSGKQGVSFAEETVVLMHDSN